jgi:hypothetical protein
MVEERSLDVKTLVERALAIRARYHELELSHHGAAWTVQEDALAFLTDAGLVGRLTMDREGRWPKAESSGELEHKLAECVWWLVVLANRMEVDIEGALERFLGTVGARLNGPSKGS